MQAFCDDLSRTALYILTTTDDDNDDENNNNDDNDDGWLSIAKLHVHK